MEVFTLEDLEKLIKIEFPNINFEFYQSNIEGEIVSKIQDAPNNFDASNN